MKAIKIIFQQQIYAITKHAFLHTPFSFDVFVNDIYNFKQISAFAKPNLIKNISFRKRKHVS